jgi:hypothetical protein
MSISVVVPKDKKYKSNCKHIRHKLITVEIHGGFTDKNVETHSSLENETRNHLRCYSPSYFRQEIASNNSSI